MNQEWVVKRPPGSIIDGVTVLVLALCLCYMTAVMALTVRWSNPGVLDFFAMLILAVGALILFFCLGSMKRLLLSSIRLTPTEIKEISLLTGSEKKIILDEIRSYAIARPLKGSTYRLRVQLSNGKKDNVLFSKPDLEVPFAAAMNQRGVRENQRL